MQLFDSVKMYVFAFCLGAVIAFAKLRQLAQRSAAAPATDFDVINNVVLALITVGLAVYLALLMRKLSSTIEKIAIVLFEVACILSLAEWLSDSGIAWAAIPHSRFLEAVFLCAIAALAGVRMFQVALRRKSTPAL